MSHEAHGAHERRETRLRDGMEWRGASANYGDVSGSALAANGNLSTRGLLDERSLREQCEDLEHRCSKQNALEATGSKGFGLYFRGNVRGLRILT